MFHTYSFLSFLSSASFVGGTVILLIDGPVGGQLFMAKIDLLILTVLSMILALLNTCK